MSDDGYTLAEALAALLMIGLAVGGLSEGMRVISRMQGAAGHTLADGRAERGARQRLVQLLQGHGPFRAGEAPVFEGGPTAFSFDCGGPHRCGAIVKQAHDGLRLAVTDSGGRTVRVVLPGVGEARFKYVGQASGETWPRREDLGPLRAVTLVEARPDGSRPLAAARLWTEHPADCEYDMVSADCRWSTR